MSITNEFRLFDKELAEAITNEGKKVLRKTLKKMKEEAMLKKVFIICSVRGASDKYKEKLEKYVTKLEGEGCLVHLPHRDTDQTAPGIEICTKNATAIYNADEVHIFYTSKSQGTHFDMGVAFAYGKLIVVVENETYGKGKGYPRMLKEWENEK